MKNRKPETENGKPEIGPDRFSFPVSCFRFPVYQEAFALELANRGIPFRKEVEFPV
jgi:hypothetical protein